MSAYPAGVRKWEILKGGWRYDDDNVSYFLNWEQLIEFEEASDRFDQDESFFEWFRDFRKKEGIKRGGGWSAGSSSRSYGTSWDDDGWEESKKKKGGALSHWWANSVYKGWSSMGGTSTADAGRLALALKAVRTVVRVVDNTVPPMSVEWATKDESYTSFGDRKIAVNPKPIIDKTTPDGQAIDVSTGFALHEAGHSEHSRDPYKILSEPPMFPLQITGTLLNIVEDSRIEAAIMESFPGFSGYFDAALDWTWESMAKEGKWPPKYGPDLGSKMNTVILACRWHDKAKTVLTDPSFAPEFIWWSAWRDEYLAGKSEPRDAIQKALDHLALDPETKKEMDDIEGAEKEGIAAGQALKDAITAAIKEGKGKLISGSTCTSHGKGITLDAATAERVVSMLEEDYQEFSPTVPAPSSMTKPTVSITKPKEDALSKRKYVGKPSGILGRLKAALIFRQELPRFTNRLLKHGGLDEEELWRWKDRDYRVFSEEVIAARPRVQLGLLVDMSGSMMYDGKLRTAQELAQLMAWATKDMEGVHTIVHGHTGDVRGKAEVCIYRLLEEGDPMTRLGLVSSLEHSNNYDGYAIEYCISDLLKRGELDEQRVLLVLSDGYPAGSSYGGRSAELHVRRVVDWGAKQGVTVIQIAIDEDVRPTAQGTMFKHFIQFESMSDLPKKLARLLSSLT